MSSAVIALSLKQSLVYGLQQALFSNYEADAVGFINFSRGYHAQPYFPGQHKPQAPLPNSPIWQKIPLQKKRTAGDVLYISAIPQLLVSSNHLMAVSGHSEIPVKNSGEKSEKTLENISQQTIVRLEKAGFNQASCEQDHNDAVSLQHSSYRGNLLLQLWAEFQIETHRPGWITFRLSNRGIGLWLAQMGSPFLSQAAIESDLPPVSKQPARQKNLLQPLQVEKILWQVQYTYARCCHLLCLWQEMQPAVGDSNLEFDSAAQPWLTASPSAGLSLIHSLIEITDDLFWIPYQSSSQQYFLFLKRAAQLCQSFELFYSRCLSGFGELSQIFSQCSATATVRKFQADFYLAAVTKNALKVLLSQYLNAEAPAEL